MPPLSSTPRLLSPSNVLAAMGWMIERGQGGCMEQIGVLLPPWMGGLSAGFLSSCPNSLINGAYFTHGWRDALCLAQEQSKIE